jgi:predicted 2-oxoglutarate/Fe(II)-dependent dioxygenase YbiX
MNREIYQNKNVFTPHEIELITQLAEALPLLQTEYGQRVAWVKFSRATDWIYTTIGPILLRVAARNGLSFSKMERLQFSVYGVGGHLPWHVDHLEKSPPEAKDRVINGVLQLSTRSSYEGGDLNIHMGDIEGPPESLALLESDMVTADRDKGSLTIIPGDLWHTVRPITSGIRKSLVFWGLK